MKDNWRQAGDPWLLAGKLGVIGLHPQLMGIAQAAIPGQTDKTVVPLRHRRLKEKLRTVLLLVLHCRPAKTKLQTIAGIHSPDTLAIYRIDTLAIGKVGIIFPVVINKAVI